MCSSSKFVRAVELKSLGFIIIRAALIRISMSYGVEKPDFLGFHEYYRLQRCHLLLLIFFHVMLGIA